MRITVFEQGLLKIAARPDAEAPCLGSSQAFELMDLSQRMGVRIAAWQDPKSLQIQQFVGMVKTGDLQLEILPKLGGHSDPSYIRQSVLKMLAATQDIQVQASDVVGFLKSSEPFIYALARLYCRRLLEAIRRGLRQEYVLHQELLPHIRGKVDWPAQARQHTTQRLEFNCIFDERSEDTPLNRTLKAALLRAGAMLERTSKASLVNELRHAMTGVSNACPPVEQMARLRTDRMNRHMEPLLALAKLILGNRNPDLGRSVQGEHNTYALVWDMNLLFEEYVGRLTRQVLKPKGFCVDLQDEASTYLARETATKRNAFRLKPDILVRRGKMPYVVADTKWKRLDPQQNTLGVSSGDVYQVLTYALRYGTERATLVYPHHPALGVPGILREFRIQPTNLRPVHLRIITIGLDSLPDVPDQILQSLWPDNASSVE